MQGGGHGVVGGAGRDAEGDNGDEHGGHYRHESLDLVSFGQVTG